MEIRRNTMLDQNNELYWQVHNRMDQFYANPHNSDIYFNKVQQIFAQTGNVDISYYRKTFIKRRLYFRLQKLNLPSLKEYISYISQTPGEGKAFIEFFTIHVTEFFRDITPYRYLEKDLILKIAQTKKAGEKIKIMSAPCSTGEEPYSLAIIVDFLKRHHQIPNPITIYASDIDSTVVEYALEGVYPIQALRNLSKISLQQNFIPRSSDYYEIHPRLRKYVEFFVHDMIDPLPFLDIDLFLCRNFLIYISKSLQNQILNNIVSTISTKGYLMLGKTEGYPLLNSRLFKAEDLKEHIYQMVS